MNVQRLVRGGLLALIAVVGASVLLQLSVRANRAAATVASVETKTAESAIVRTPDAVTVMYDRRGGQESLLRGWSDPEPGSGVWSLGREAVLKLPAPAAGGDLDLTLKTHAFVAPGVPAQRVILHAGGAQIADWRLTSVDLHTLHATVPRAALSDLAELELRLELPDADAPSRRVPGSTDPRVIAIKLQSVEVRTAKSPTEKSS